jgi:integral membrane protein
MSTATSSSDPTTQTESMTALRVLAVVEGLSFVVLLVCSVLKRTTTHNLVPIAGPVHGFLYLMVVLLVLENLRSLRWSWWFTAVMLTVGSPGIHFALQAQVRRERRQAEQVDVPDYPPR